LLTAPVTGQQPQLQIGYAVKVASTQERLFHITTEIRNIKQPQLDLSLPVWTPGWYTIENYGKNLLRFRVSDAKGNTVPHTRIRKQTWRVETTGLDQIRVEFEYRATVLALNQAKITSDYAFFTGIQLFLQPEGHPLIPSTVRFDLPEGWSVASALKETSDPRIFSASDYDTLVDSPTALGKFDITRFEIEGKPHHLVTLPAGAFSKQDTDRFIPMLTAIARAQSAIFGGLPYEKYVYFYLFARPESNASGALEHSNSYVAFAPPPPFATPEAMIGTASHEFFHVWNVKRIRPAEMWPYDYSRENETPLLWVSEGFTTYYAEVAAYRAGIITKEQFLDSVGGAAGDVERNEARRFISPAEASVSTWLGYDTPVEFSISYYPQGQNLGALLDLSIRHDTKGAASLDDVMRALYRESYQAGRGFTTSQLLAIINRISKRDYSDFFQRYVWGVEIPPYDAILGYAGYRFEKTAKQAPQLGFWLSMTPDGALVTRVEPGSAAAEAGIQSGDLLSTIDGVEVRRGLRAVRDRLAEQAGKSVKVIYRRTGKEETSVIKVRMAEESTFRIIEVTQPTPEQRSLRDGWLKRVP
jgi:predicted metalloprotease with PDZ domain